MFRIRKKLLFYYLAILSALLSAITGIFDVIYSYEYIKDPWSLCLSIFIVGLIFTIFISIFLSIGKKKLGSYIDPSFNGLRLIGKKEFCYQLLAATGNAIWTIAYYFVVSEYGDPVIIQPFLQVVILYLILTESIAEKDAPTLAEIESAVIVTSGALLASLSLTRGINIEALLVVFLILNPSWVLFSIYQRKLKLLKINGSYNDSINIRFWNLLLTTILVLIISFFVKRDSLYDSVYASLHFFHILLPSIVLIFLSYILYIRALGLGKASVTQAVKSFTIVFSIPFSMALTKFTHITLFESPIHALIKMIGITLVIMGVISFALTEVKAYIFIKAKTGYSVKDLLNTIWRIRGITSVAAVAGKYDIIAKARIRTLGKGYERIIRALEKVKGIERFEWQSILKEWEKI